VEPCHIWTLKFFSVMTNYILWKCNLTTWLAQRRGREPAPMLNCALGNTILPIEYAARSFAA